MAREPDPFAELDRRASGPIHYCPDCETEVSRRGALCGECWEKYEQEPGPLFDTMEEARGER